MENIINQIQHPRVLQNGGMCEVFESTMGTPSFMAAGMPCEVDSFARERVKRLFF